MKVTVIGLGFVGKPLVEHCLQADYEVTGVDISRERIEELEKSEIGRKVKFSDNIDVFNDSDIYILALPTPIDAEGRSNLEAIHTTCRRLASFISTDQVVIIESTYPPGTTRNSVIPALKAGHKDKKIQICYSPERINPGDNQWNLANTPKLFSCIDNETRQKVQSFYGNFVNELIYVESFEVAETAKLLENMYRFVNINFINEFQRNCELMGINSLEVIEAASSKPFGFQKFLPSLGVGGHCIPIAPFHFLDTLKTLHSTNSFLEQGNYINQSQASSVITKIEKYFPLRNKNVLIVGITYKFGVPDVRESPVIAVINDVKSRGANVKWFDTLVKEFNGEENGELDSAYDLVLICVKQPDPVISEVVRKNGIVIDISNGLEFRRLK